MSRLNAYRKCRIMDTTPDPAYLEKRLFVNFNDEIREVIGEWEVDGEQHYRLKPTPRSSAGSTVSMSSAQVADIDASLILPVESMTDAELEQALSDAENERLIVSDRKQATAQKQKKAARKVRPTTKEFRDKMDAFLNV